MGAFGTVGAVNALRRGDATVPAHLRADRWELTREGQAARARGEQRCGAFADGVWVDRPESAAQPVLLGAPDTQRDCFAEQVAPAFTRGALGD
jgi:hypothetical protein